jgi:hypothetical protein
MHGKVDAASSQGLFNLLGEHSLSANFRQGNIGDFVACGVDDFDLDLMALLA